MGDVDKALRLLCNGKVQLRIMPAFDNQQRFVTDTPTNKIVGKSLVA